ncbi:ArsR/SmtB family transcription factor [Paenibacillus aceris]|uniref:DNA-binding transcriptional ArsR family regulator n=1 Tax=Paenibacillus aceris TaxID=869555 RepID=A0ABS4I7G4_9BACL|nr:helix-turn-helix domain-containing protein [Paenibacillus aceris]MBP1966854.1 DNA-binding transcriptional ArsR family regulator [Paenibacillus aceris]NHW38925.1 helix-turn-helix transcriptional regulator [Paenibacillus aceris]
MLNDIQDRYYIESPEQATVLLNPIRGEIIAQLLEPGSAAEVARTLGETAQRINYHLKALEKAGLVQRVGTRQVRNLVEVLYRAIAKTFVLADSLSMKPETVQKLKDQSSLAHLVTTSERIRRDAMLLMEQSDVGEIIPSATLQLQVHLADEGQRQAFIEEYAALVQQLVERYAAPAGKEKHDPYHVLLAVYPKPKE